MTAVIAHNLGFSPIGGDHELEKAREAYRRGDINRQQLEAVDRELRKAQWKLQADAGLELVSTGDFAWGEQLFSLSAATSNTANWFDTDYQYLVPEFHAGQTFQLSGSRIIDETAEAIALGYKVKPVILGPLSYLYRSKEKGAEVDRLDLLDNILPAYRQLLAALAATGAGWVQIDEPILVLDLPAKWQRAFESVYNRLQQSQLNILLATYFGALGTNLSTVMHLPVAGLHIDTVCAPEQLLPVIDRLPAYKILSIGVVDGRNSQHNDMEKSLRLLKQAQERLGSRLWVAPSCPLLHLSENPGGEEKTPADSNNRLALATQKVHEVVTLKTLLTTPTAMSH